MTMSFGQAKQILYKTYQEWSEDQAPRLGAALAFYTMLSLAPLLILLIAIAGLVFGEEAASGQLFSQIRDMVGADGAKAIEEMVANASKPGHGIIASVIGFALLVFGASSVAGELRYALNAIWDNEPNPDEGIKDMVKQRSYALVVVLGCGFLLLVSLVVSGAIAAAGSYMSHLLPLPAFVLQAINFLVGLAVIAGVFAVLFKYLPDVDVQWHDVLLGAAFTAVLFGVGKFAIGLYLGKASIGSAYGAAGSLAVVLVWVYYSSQIMFFGAEFTQVYADQHGSRPHRSKTPRPVDASPAATGNAALMSGNETEKGSGVVGSVLGSALAVTKAAKALRRK